MSDGRQGLGVPIGEVSVVYNSLVESSSVVDYTPRGKQVE